VHARRISGNSVCPQLLYSCISRRAGCRQTAKFLLRAIAGAKEIERAMAKDDPAAEMASLRGKSGAKCILAKTA